MQMGEKRAFRYGAIGLTGTVIACIITACLVAFTPMQANAATNDHASLHKTYRIIYHLAGGTQPSTQITEIKADKSLKASKLKKPTKRGYVFDGWYTDRRHTEKAVLLQGVKDKALRSVYAKWSVQTFPINYKVKGGTLPSSTKYFYVTKSGKSKLAKPKRLGYTFGGWYADKGFTKKVTSIPRWTVGKKTFYAKWTKNVYTVSYNANGGTLPSARPSTYTVTTRTTALPIPNRSGYSFMGWRDLKSGKTRWTIDQGSVGNIAVRAQWRKRLYIAHRGYYAESEQNSIMAFRAAKTKGFNGVEADVRFTKDNVPVLRHSTDIAVVAYRNDGNGDVNIVIPLSLLTLNKLQAVLLNSIVSGENGKNVTTLKELFEECKNSGMVAVVHLKEGTSSQVQTAVKLAASYGMQNKVYWSSSDTDMLEYVKKYDSDANLMYGPDTVNASIIAKATELRRGGSDVLLSISRSHATKSAIDLCRNAGIPVNVWDLNDERGVSGLDQYVNMYMLDGLSGSLPA